MTPDFRCGLVVGKFAPLHKGHVLLIRRALAQCAHVVILSYSNPELKFATPELRERWLADLFPESTRIVATAHRLCEWFANSPRDQRPALPHNDAADDEHRQFVAVLLERLVRNPVDAVFTSEAYGNGFAESLTRWYQARDPRAPLVHPVCVDLARRDVPISGSALRDDLWGHWRCLPAPVARTLVGRVVFLGGESSGKSTLAAAMAERMDTRSVAEYGRERWAANGGILEFDDLAAIAREQITREDSATLDARRWLFCDTSALTTLFYSLELFGRADPMLEAATARPYALIVLCAPDFPFVQDGTRQDEAFRQRQHGWYIDQLTARGLGYVLVTGSVAHRVETLVAFLKN